MPSSKQYALSIIASSQMSTAVDISKLQVSAFEQLKKISILESEAALRAVFVGVALHRIKASLKHGEFRPWISSQEDAVKKSQVNNYMRLATVFIEKHRATKAELLCVTGEKGELLSGDEQARSFAKKAQSFVGECSLNELLIKYAIKGVTREGDDPETAGAAAPATGQEAQLWFSEVAGHLYGFRTTVLKEEAIMRLPPAKLREILAEHDAQNSELHELCKKALGK